MPLSTIKTGVEKDHDVDFRNSDFCIDLSKGDYIIVKYYKLGFEDNEFFLPNGAPTSEFKMEVEKFSCKWSDKYTTNAICDNAKNGKKVFVCSNGNICFGDYVSGVWYNIDIT